MDKTILRPNYYKDKNGKDLFDKFEDGELEPSEVPGFYKGNVLKYIKRFRFKNGVEDLKKARVYLDRLIAWEERNEK